MKGKEANFLAKAHILSMYSVNIRDSGETSTGNAAVGMVSRKEQVSNLIKF